MAALGHLCFCHITREVSAPGRTAAHLTPEIRPARCPRQQGFYSSSPADLQTGTKSQAFCCSCQEPAPCSRNDTLSFCTTLKWGIERGAWLCCGVCTHLAVLAEPCRVRRKTGRRGGSLTHPTSNRTKLRPGTDSPFIFYGLSSSKEQINR